QLILSSLSRPISVMTRIIGRNAAVAKQNISLNVISFSSPLSPRWRRSSSRTGTTRRLICRQTWPPISRLCLPPQTAQSSCYRSADRNCARSRGVPLEEVSEGRIAELALRLFDYLGYRVALLLFA